MVDLVVELSPFVSPLFRGAQSLEVGAVVLEVGVLLVGGRARTQGSAGDHGCEGGVVVGGRCVVAVFWVSLC